MHKTHTTLLLAALAFVLMVVAPGTHAQVGTSELIEDRMMVRLVPEGEEQQLFDGFFDAFAADPANAGITMAVLDEIADRRIFLLEINIPDGTNLDALELRLETDYTAWLLWAELLYENDAPEGQTGSTYVDGIAEGFTSYKSQYASSKLNLPAARQRGRGAGVKVAILDTGVDATHPLLAGHIASGGFNFITETTDTTDVGDGIDTDGDGDIDEMVGHGTYVAGLVRLVAPDAKLLPVTVLNGDGFGNMWVMMRGLFHAIEEGADVINISIRSDYNSQGVEDAIEFAEDLGIIVVGAAANFDREEPREFPAMMSSAIGVAAVDDADQKADFSNYNNRISLSAPGASLPAGAPDIARSIISSVPGGGWAIWEGTSAAAPLVAGAAAVIRSQEQDWPMDHFGWAMIEDRLLNTAVNIDALNPAYEELLGEGRLDVGAAAALGPDRRNPGDVNSDGTVGLGDLLGVLSNWGEGYLNAADLNDDDFVNLDDLLQVLSSWGTIY